MLGGLIEANVASSETKRRDFELLGARVGVFVTDIDEGVTLEFKKGTLVVHNGLQPRREPFLGGDMVISLFSPAVSGTGVDVPVVIERSRDQVSTTLDRRFQY